LRNPITVSHPARGRASRLSFALAVVVAVLAFGACGSSKPDYCSKTSDLEQSVKALGNVDVVGNGLNALKSQLKKIESDATAVVNAAKSDFPSETSAIDSSVQKLKTSVQNIASSPSASKVATVTGDAATLATSVKEFTDATGSKCS
jgi:hypothetical protein